MVGSSWLSLWPYGSIQGPVGGGGVQASVLWFPGLPRGTSWREGPAVMWAMGGVWWPWGPPQRSKPRALCPSGCYPQCPKGRPIYDEDLKQCVRADKCGCYVGDTRYPPGGSVPTDKDCQSWYLSSRAGPGGGQTHVYARAHTRTHATRSHTQGHARGHVCPPQEPGLGGMSSCPRVEVSLLFTASSARRCRPHLVLLLCPQSEPGDGLGATGGREARAGGQGGRPGGPVPGV